MASLSKRVATAIQKEFIEGTIFRVDLDRVDIAPDGSTGILRSLPLTGDRDKVKPGDPVRVINVAGERVALAGDVALDESEEIATEDASGIALEERLLSIGSEQKDHSHQLSDLSDVDTTTTPPVANNFLGWDTLSKKWVPKIPAGGTDAATLTGLAPDGTGAANAHVPVTEADGTLKLANLDVSGAGNFPWMQKAALNLTGGGQVSVNVINSLYYLKWTQRFIVISNGRAADLCPSGYYNIDCPASGTVALHGGATGTRAIDATYGIPISGWEALYYEIPFSAGATSNAANFHIVNYTGNFDVPASWILLAVVNSDVGIVQCAANGGFVLHNTGTYISSQPQPVAMSFIMDGSGQVLTAGLKGAIAIPYPIQVTRVAFYSQETGSVNVQILKFNTHTGWPASDYFNFGDHIMTSAQKIEWTGLSYLFYPGNILRFWLQSVTSVKNLSIHLTGFRL